MTRFSFTFRAEVNGSELRNHALRITTCPSLMDGPEHGGEKERPAFSATQEFEVKILWTGPENGFSDRKSVV